MTEKHLLEIGLFVLVAVIFVAGGVKMFVVKNSVVENKVSEVAMQNVEEQKQVSETNNSWKTYHNEKYGIEFKYPSEWMLKETETSETNALKVSGLDISLYVNVPSASGGENVFMNNLFSIFVTPKQYQYKTEGMGDHARFSVFGSLDNSANCNNRMYPQYCKTVSFSSGSGVSEYLVGTQINGGSVYIKRRAVIEHKGHVFSGVELSSTAISKCSWSQSKRWQDCIGPFAQGDTAYSPENNLAFMRHVQESIANGNVDKDDKKTIEVFDKILSTLKLLD